METESAIRWLVIFVAAAAIVALVLLARGGTERGNPDAPPAAVAIVALARPSASPFLHEGRHER